MTNTSVTPGICLTLVSLNLFWKIWYHLSKIGCHNRLKSCIFEDNGPFLQLSLYHGSWRLGDVRSQPGHQHERFWFSYSMMFLQHPKMIMNWYSKSGRVNAASIKMMYPTVIHGLYGSRCPLSPKKAVKLNHSLTHCCYSENSIFSTCKAFRPR